MEQDFRAVLLAAGAVTALAPAARINWGSHPQGAAYPAIVLSVISGAEGYTYNGPDGLLQGRVQVDCYGHSYASAKGLSRAVIVALGGYSDADFQAIFHASTRDSREGGSNEAERPYRVSMDFMTHWRET